MFTIKIKTIFLTLTLLCSISLCAQERVVDVSAREHPLLDIYLYGLGQANLGTSVRSLTTDRSTLIETGTTLGVGIGYHQPYANLYPSIRVGYNYKNHSFVGSQYPGGISTHWLNLNLQIKYSWIMLGVESNVQLSHSLPHPLPWDCLGITPDCFNPATLGIYVGWDFPIIDNLFVTMIMEYEPITCFNNKRLGNHLMDAPTNTGLLYKLGLSYRIFTTGKKHY